METSCPNTTYFDLAEHDGEQIVIIKMVGTNPNVIPDRFRCGRQNEELNFVIKLCLVKSRNLLFNIFL